MLSGFDIWSKFDIELTLENYRLIENKLSYIESFIEEYVDIGTITYDVLTKNLELDATVSYFSLESAGSHWTPWLVHESMTAVIDNSDLDPDLLKLITELQRDNSTINLFLFVSKIANTIKTIITKLKAVTSSSNGVLLLYAVDVGLIQIISIINELRVKRILATSHRNQSPSQLP